MKLKVLAYEIIMVFSYIFKSSISPLINLTLGELIILLKNNLLPAYVNLSNIVNFEFLSEKKISSHKWEPTKPAPPVIKYFIIRSEI